MPFEKELSEVLPADLPNRQILLAKTAGHLRLIETANQQFNLTRISSPREAAIKHVLDSLVPWRHFASARRVLDIGTGAGFPGIPLALALPETKFTLSESIQKKARFVEAAVENLDIENLAVSSRRAEELLEGGAFEIATARAVAPLSRLIPLFSRGIRSGTRLLLYKGPDVDHEIAEAAAEAARRKVRIAIVERYELPEGQGVRTIIELSANR